MLARVPCVVLGSGNIGTDLMVKLLRSSILELTAVVGVDPESDGLRRARESGLDTSAAGVEWVLDNPERSHFVFDATSSSAHKQNAPRILEAGLRIVDLTPAKLGPGIVPAVNLREHANARDVNLISCGGQATIPIVAAVNRTSAVVYAEIVATIASASAGPGTRQNIDEFTRTTASGLESIGGAGKGKAIIVLNPAVPPILMTNTIFCSISNDADEATVQADVIAMVGEVAKYVPGYRLKTNPIFDAGRVTVFIEVEGRGDYLPSYAGNLDIMTAAAVRVGEELATSTLALTP
jgi:acetaldehyde dehydrogenase